jgi:hypothetical protein
MYPNKGQFMSTIWKIKLPNVKFAVSDDGENLDIVVAETKESEVFLGLTKALQSLVMKTIREKNPVKNVPPPTRPMGAHIPIARDVPQQPNQVAPVVKQPNVIRNQGPNPSVSQPAPGGVTRPVHQNLPNRPPMSPSAIKPKRNSPSASFGKLKSEQEKIIQARIAKEQGNVEGNHSIPISSYERLVKETAARAAAHMNEAEISAEMSDANPIQVLGITATLDTTAEVIEEEKQVG